jgi:hypothetical protein
VPTNRRPLRRRRGGQNFTSEIIELYRRLRVIYGGGDAAAWREAYQERRRLDHLLGRCAPWQVNVLFDTINDETSPYPATSAGGQDWPEALQLRQALDAAIEE